VVRLGDGTDESPPTACSAALDRIWPYTAELFDADAVDAADAAAGLGPPGQPARLAGRCAGVLAEATLPLPPTPPFAAPAARTCTASTWVSCWPRCSRCRAAYPGGVW
jgi:ring-1,2-phenylacetyl-CoA epoxidase subunit PaaC